MNHLDVLKQIEDEYAPYSEYAVSELKKVEALRADWERTKDPEWLAFRENPKTQKLFQHCANMYRQVKLQMANDDGSMTQDMRIRLHISSLWSAWFMQTLGGSPESVKKQVEQEIVRFAEVAGVKLE